jgi:uncharacterized protein YjeT (DUF2065 family)
MSEAVAAIGLVLVLEGVLYALFPEFMKRMAAQAIQTPGDTLRVAGVVSAALGVALVWLVRG